jgi:DNA-binding transcriptional ArsR family regulator
MSRVATQQTLDTLFGGKAATRVLLFIENYGEGYASWIAKTFQMPLSEVQKQLSKFEDAGILVSRKVGTSRMYTWNPRDPALDGLRQMLRNTLEYGVSREKTSKYFRQRRRPRRKGKPL